jgi:hypothetical protein
VGSRPAQIHEQQVADALHVRRMRGGKLGYLDVQPGRPTSTGRRDRYRMVSRLESVPLGGRESRFQNVPERRRLMPVHSGGREPVVRDLDAEANRVGDTLARRAPGRRTA